MQTDFYLLEQGGPERALAPLAGKVLAVGGRLLVVAEEAAERQRLSQALWQASGTSFLANDVAGGAHDARQPILISDRIEPANQARFLALADGIWREPDAGAFDRVLLVFGQTGREAARETWRLLKSREGWECRFFRQEQGRWQQAG
ncbi:DNA polymerase III subunit chi [Novosphingobium umbonatum]|uniref:DNA polymerase III subunit chi n=1 Tax=Novosphingobium umbonatum TaxID=1908524 RepID=A0A437N393_9SPHN|nr:DNA polymerase III subunit chi [Novosphingobium umbonatum]RVU04407.1 DNA polymerase III subunit chi [Novosphingobium umbonatum]